MKRVLLFAASLALVAAATACFGGKSAEEKARLRGEQLDKNFTFQAEGGAYDARLMAIVRSDSYDTGLAPLLPRAQEMSPEPAIPEDAWRAASKLRLPASPDGRTMIVAYGKCLYGLDLATAKARWRLEIGKGLKTVFPYRNEWIVKTGKDWEACAILDPAQGKIVATDTPAPEDLPPPSEIDKDYVKFSLAETGVHRYEFLPAGPTVRCYSKSLAPRLTYETFGAFDPKTDETLWVMTFRYGVEAFNRVQDRYFFLAKDGEGKAWVYLFQIAPKAATKKDAPGVPLIR